MSDPSLHIAQVKFSDGIPLASYESMLATVYQAVFEFRDTYRDPEDDTKPIIKSYEQNGISVTLMSNRPSYMLIQIQSSAGRTGIVIDSQSDHPVVIDVYDGPSGNEPAGSYAPTPSDENASTLLSVYSYITDITSIGQTES